MDLSKIFLKGACPTSIGGQAVMEGIMMKGVERTAVAIRLPDGRIHIKTSPNKHMGKWAKIPVIRGVAAFVSSLEQGTETLMYSANVLDDNTTEGEEYKESRFESWVNGKFGEKKAWKIMVITSVVIALVLSIGIFILLPTAAVNLLGRFTSNYVILNLSEGILRLAMFIGYIAVISKMSDIKTVFQYHGAEHKTIHCFENGLELTPENAQKFYTLHPRCGTSFLMFVMVISLVLFSLLGWPNLLERMLSRLLLIPVVAGVSYELLKWAGKSDNWLIRVLSLPGIYLQKLTTKDPSDSQLEVAIAAIKAVTVPKDTPFFEGICGLDGRPIEASEEETPEESEDSPAMTVEGK